MCASLSLWMSLCPLYVSLSANLFFLSLFYVLFDLAASFIINIFSQDRDTIDSLDTREVRRLRGAGARVRVSCALRKVVFNFKSDIFIYLYFMGIQMRS